LNELTNDILRPRSPPSCAGYFEGAAAKLHPLLIAEV
jgi:hypothetical protein